MKYSKLFIPVLIATIISVSQSQEIKGRILDMHSHPVANAQLSLRKCGISGTTDSSGNFRLVPTAVVYQDRTFETNLRLQLKNNVFTIVSSSNNNLKVRIFDGHGRTCSFVTIVDKPGTFIGKMRSSVSGILFAQIRSVKSGMTETFRFIDGLNSGNVQTISAESIHLKKTGMILPGKDTLQCTKDGFLRKRIAVEFGKDSVLNLYMYPESVSITPSEYPVIDGSTSTQPVGIVLAATVLGTTYGYADQNDGSKKMVAFSAARQTLADSINTMIVKHNTTHDAYVNVIKGTAGLGLIARSPSVDEIALAESLKVKIEVQPFAIDAFVFLVNRKNSLDNITLEQIRQIYSGGDTNWISLGGPDLKIRPYQRERNSGSQEMMISLVMKETPLISSPDMVLMGMMGPFNALNTDTAGLGYTVYFYGKNMAPEQYVKFVSVNGVAATSENISNHTYPLWADVYLVNRVDLDPSSNAAYMRELILSPQGQEIIERCGYVPISRK